MAAKPPSSIAATKSARVANGNDPPTPKAEPVGVGKLLDRDGSGRTDVKNPGFGQAVLQAQARPTLLGRRSRAPIA